MEKKKEIPIEIPMPKKQGEIVEPIDPEEPLIVPEEIPDFIPDREEPFENPPYELPPLGEGP